MKRPLFFALGILFLALLGTTLYLLWKNSAEEVRGEPLEWAKPSQDIQQEREMEALAQKGLVFSHNGVELTADVALTQAQRVQGLSGSSPLPKHHGLFFVFKEDDSHGIWMKDMKYAIDIIWLDANLRVVSIKKNATPESFPEVFYSSKPARFVFELSSGASDEVNLQEGDVLSVVSAPKELSHLLTQ